MASMKVLTLVDSFGKMCPEGGIVYDSGQEGY